VWQLTPERRIIALLILLIVASLSNTAWQVASQYRQTYDQILLKRMDAIRHRAEGLSGKGWHREAAYAYLDLAGIVNELIHKDAEGAALYRESATQPCYCYVELSALDEFAQAGGELQVAYTQLLKSKYPAWKVASWNSSMPRP
jgi:hypothetical protein